LGLVIKDTVTDGTSTGGNRGAHETVVSDDFIQHPDLEDHVNVRRANRKLGDGVRLNEKTGSVSTHSSRAHARLDRARTDAIALYRGIR